MGPPCRHLSLSEERLQLPLPGDLHFIGLPLDLICVEGAAACQEGGRCGLAGCRAGDEGVLEKVRSPALRCRERKRQWGLLSKRAFWESPATSGMGKSHWFKS